MELNLNLKKGFLYEEKSTLERELFEDKKFADKYLKRDQLKTKKIQELILLLEEMSKKIKYFEGLIKEDYKNDEQSTESNTRNQTSSDNSNKTLYSNKIKKSVNYNSQFKSEGNLLINQLISPSTEPNEKTKSSDFKKPSLDRKSRQTSPFGFNYQRGVNKNSKQKPNLKQKSEEEKSDTKSREILKSDGKSDVKSDEIQKSDNTLKQLEFTKDYNKKILSKDIIREAVNSFKKALGYASAEDARRNLEKINIQFETSVQSGESNDNKSNIKVESDKKSTFKELNQDRKGIDEASGEEFIVIYNKGILLSGESKYEEAITYFKKSIDLNPTFKHAYLNIGAAYRLMGKNDDAIKNFIIATKLDQEFTEAYFNLGNIYRIVNDIASAISCFKKVIELDKNYKDAYFNLALAYRLLNNYTDAVANFNKVIEIDPNDKHAWFLMGNIVKCRKESQQAITYYKKVLAIDKFYKEAHFNMGTCLLDLDKKKEALISFNKVLLIDDNNIEARFLKAEIESFLKGGPKFFI